MLDIMVVTGTNPETGKMEMGFTGHLNMDAEETVRMLFEKRILERIDKPFEEFIQEISHEMHATAVRAVARIREMHNECQENQGENNGGNQS